MLAPATQTTLQPRIRPFFTPPDLHARFAPIVIWFTDPPGMVVHFDDAHTVDTRTAEFMIEAFYQFVATMPANTRFHNFYSWTEMVGYHSAARNRLVNWGLEIRKIMDAVTLNLSTGSDNLVRMGMQVACTTLSMAGTNIEIVYDNDTRALLRTIGLRPSALTR